MKKFFAIVVLLAAIIGGYVFYQHSCIETRLVFDIGSGTMKSSLAQVNRCSGTLWQQIESKAKNVKLANCLEKKPHGKLHITQECLELANKSFHELEDEYNIKCNSTSCAGIATEWARRAENSNELIDYLKSHGLKINVVTAEEEGRIAFNAVRLMPEVSVVNIDHIIVWDIGGASYQLSTMDRHHKLHVFGGKYGVEVFENELREIMNKPAGTPQTYLTPDEIKEAIKIAHNLVSPALLKDHFLIQKARDHNVKVFATGRPFNMANLKQMYFPKVFHKADLLKNAEIFCGQTPQSIKQNHFPELADHYLETAQYSMIIMYTIMDILGIDQVEIVDTAMTNALLVDEKYWQ
jgi:exopolyphosphatase/pppGpp-phosphohydrolase